MTSPCRLMWIDTETSGLVKGDNAKQNKHQIIQLAAVVTEPNNKLTIRNYFMSYIKFNTDLIWDTGAENVHKISQSSLINEPDEKMVSEAFTAFCQMNMPFRFAGYNVAFDIAMVDGMIDRQQCFFPQSELPSYDVMVVAKKQLQIARYRLVDVREHFKISCTGAHDAARDIYDTLKIARFLRELKKSA